MRTVTQREPEDIDLGEKPNSIIAASLAVGMLLMTISKPGLSREEQTADIEKKLKGVIASLLDTLENAGYSIVKNEIPSAFVN